MALAVAFFSATQDIVIDAYRTDLLPPEERGMGAAMTTGGYNVAMLVSGGLAMVMAAQIGWQATYLLMSGLMLVHVLATFWGPEPKDQIGSPKTLVQAVVEPFKDYLTRESAVAILIFILIYKLGNALTLTLSTAFLLKGLGFTLTDVGAIYKVVGLIAVLMGVFLGGAMMIRLGLYRALMSFGILQALSNFSYLLLAIIGKSYFAMISAVFIEYFCGGLAGVAFIAFLTSLCNTRYSAAQYALLTAFAAVGRVFIGPAAGVMVEHLGWIEFYFWACVLSFPGLMLLAWLKKHPIFDLPQDHQLAREKT